MEYSYNYSPLDSSSHEIRLLKLAPAKEMESEVLCSIETHNLDDCPFYEALSYAWGDWIDPGYIYVDSCRVNITRNLHEALTNLRDSSTARVLWVDAICIHQSDTSERNHQVRQMRHIYASAHRVLVWLGKSDSEIDAAMDLINSREENGDTSAKRHLIWDDEKRQSAMPGEAVVAKLGPRFYCGRTWIPWDAINIFVVALFATRTGGWEEVVSQTGAYLLLQFRNLREFWHNGQEQSDPDTFASFPPLEKNEMGVITLEGLLRLSSNRSASDPRDHVFANLGLLPDGENSIRVDYRKSTSTVYQAAMLEAMKNSYTTELLYGAVIPHGEVDLPSWCVDFSRNNWLKDIFNWYDRPSFLPMEIHDSWRQSAQVECYHDPESGQLTIPAKIIGDINTVIIPKCASVGLNESDSKTWWEGMVTVLENIENLRYNAKLALTSRLGLDQALSLIKDGLVWLIYADGRTFDEIFYILRHTMDPNFNPKEVTTIPEDWSAVEKWWRWILASDDEEEMWRRWILGPDDEEATPESREDCSSSEEDEGSSETQGSPRRMYDEPEDDEALISRMP